MAAPLNVTACEAFSLGGNIILQSHHRKSRDAPPQWKWMVEDDLT
jgi:hypothetical protein